MRGVCPADCIYVRGLDNPPDHPVSPGERYGYVYEINYLRCIHCDMCVEACPTEAITESKLFEFSFTNRSDAIYTKPELVVNDDGIPQKLPGRTGAPARTKTAPAGCGRRRLRARAYEGEPSGRPSSATASEHPRAARRQPRRRGHGEHLLREVEREAITGASAARGAAHDEPVGGRDTGPTRSLRRLRRGLVVGALGVVLSRNPVHSALILVMTLFAVAVLFVEQEAEFLAAVQIIVYAGAVVVLFLFVIMLLGVDRKEDIGGAAPRSAPVAMCLRHRPREVLLLARDTWPTGAPSVTSPRLAGGQHGPVGKSVFTTYLFAFEVTAALLVVAVVGAVVLARRPRRIHGEAAAPPSPTKEHEADDGPGPGDPGPDEAETDDDPEATAWVPGGQDAERGRARPERAQRSGGERPMSLSGAWYLGLAAIVFTIGAIGLLVRRNVLIMFMCIELMLNAANLTFVTFARMLNDIGGQAIVFFVLVVAAAEVVVGLGASW